MQDTHPDTASQNDDATPETDREWFAAHQTNRLHYGDEQLVTADFARRLERERNLAKGQAIYWQDKATQFAKERDELLAVIEHTKECSTCMYEWEDCEEGMEALAIISRIKGGAA